MSFRFAALLAALSLVSLTPLVSPALAQAPEPLPLTEYPLPEFRRAGHAARS